MMPKLDFARLLNDTGDLRKSQASFNLDLHPYKNRFKFSFVRQQSRLKTMYKNTDYEQSTAENEIKEENVLSNIRSIIYPLFIGVFLLFDILLLTYRFSWLRGGIQVFKKGIEHRIPYNAVTKTVLFLLTGKDVPLPEDSWDDLTDYRVFQSQNFWNDRKLYFIYCQSNPRDKRVILQQQLQQNGQKKPPSPTETGCWKTTGYRLIKLLYQVFHSPVFWRFVLICGFVLILCLVAKLTNDLVTMKTAMFLLDTDALVPMLDRQNEISSEVIRNYGNYLNSFLIGYKDSLDVEVQTINSMLVDVAERQVG